MGGTDVAAGEEILNHAGIPTFHYPDTAVRAFNYMWRYAYNLRGLYETPSLPEDTAECTPNRAQAGEIIKQARESGRTILTESESKQLLAAYGIPTVQTLVAATEDEAVAFADKIGYPVVLKLFSETITHKTDVGGVQLNLRDADAVRSAWRAIQASVTEKVGARAFPGRDGAADDQARRLRADHRQQPGFAVRSGAAVRHGRPTGGSLQGPRRWRCRR